MWANVYRDSLEDAFRSLEILSDRRFKFGGQDLAVRPELTGTEESLRTALMELFYVSVYSRPFGGVAPNNQSESQDISDLLSAANTSRVRHQTDWIIHKVNHDGSALASRHGRTRTLILGQYFSQDAQLPIVSDSRVTVLIPRESRPVGNGFYFAFGETPSTIEEDRRLARVYFNMDATGAQLLMRLLTDRFNTFEIPFTLKILNNPALYERRDVAVLYISRYNFRISASLISEILPHLSKQLKNGTPLFTKRLAPGLAVADDPSDGESFGQSRCKLLANAVIMAWKRGDQTAEARLKALIQEFGSHGLSLEKPYLSKDSTDIYVIPSV